MARKGENIFYRKDGRWEARYVKERDYSGKNIYGYVYGKTYQEVKNKRTEVMLRMNKNIEKVDNDLFKVKINEWLNKNKINLKLSTLNYYSNIINKHIKPTFGNLKTNQISESMIYNFMYNKKNEINENTLRQVMVIFKSILKYSGLNFEIKLPKIHKKILKTLNDNELKRIENYSILNLNKYTLGILISLHTGLRLGEVCALKWKNVDFVNKILTVEYTLSRVQINDSKKNEKTKVILNLAKTDNSIRVIPLDKVILKCLNEHKKLTLNDERNFVLTNSIKAIDARTFYYNYKKILKNLDMKDYTFHILRHTFATRCCHLGFDIKSLSEVLGHSNVKTTLSIYVHSNLEYKKEFFNTIFINC